MKQTIHHAAVFALLLTFGFPISNAFAQGTAFTYQGRLNDGANPASGIYDLRFAIYDAASAGNQQGNLLTNSATLVSNGLFTVTLDFSNQFPGAARWLEIGVRTNGAANFFTLNPRQALTPAPYAIFAEGANAAGLNGTIPASNIGGSYGNAVNFGNGLNSFDGTFYGLFYGSSFVGGTFVGSGSGLSDVWHTSGNFGTIPGINFLGTADNQSLIFKVNGQQAFLLEPNAIAPIVVGGIYNSVDPSDAASTIAGGHFHRMDGNVTSSTIGGGYNNVMETNVVRATIAGGNANIIQAGAFQATIGGGAFNAIGTNASSSVIAGGNNNTIQAAATSATIAGGYVNVIGTNAPAATIAGGYGNIIGANSYQAEIGGGFQNSNGPGSSYSVVAGGYQNMIGTNTSLAAIGGGAYNTMGTNDTAAVITGGYQNGIGNNSYQSMIGGGYGNSIGAGTPYSVVAGGIGNVIGPNMFQSVIGGGVYNSVGGGWAVIAGGYYNTNNGLVAFVGAGDYNYIGPIGYYSVLGGGVYNNLGGSFAVIGGGYSNSVAGYCAAVPGGASNIVSGAFGFAAGQQAQALHPGAFVWADSQSGPFSSTATNQFAVRAGGGVAFVTGGAGMTLDGQPVPVSGAVAPTSGSPSYIQNQTATPQVASFNITGSMTAGSFTVGGGNASGTVGVNTLAVTNKIRVPGAGVDTATPAFVHVATGANIEALNPHRTTISNPLCDGDPNAMLIITHNYNPGGGGGILDANPTSVYYNPTLSKWQIYHDNFAALATNCAWNVLVIKL